jgi:hypothetical protein
MHGAYFKTTAQFNAALKNWHAHSPNMGVLILLPEAEANTLPDLQSSCKELGVTMVGAMFPAIIVNSGFATHGMSVIHFEIMPPYFLLAKNQTQTSQLSRQMASATEQMLASRSLSGTPTLFTIFDGMLPNIETILTDLYGDLAERVQYAGVNAGSETFKSIPCLFDCNQIIANGVLGFLLPSIKEIQLAHGYLHSKTILSATSSVANQVDTISYRPAFEVYREMIRDEYGIEVTHENFYDYAAHFPFGVMTVCDTLVRIPIGFNAEGALFFIGEVPSFSLLVLLKAPTFETSQCIESLSAKLKQANAEVSDHTLLVFYCAGRRMHFQADAVNEIIQLKELTNTTHLLGALSLGEIDTIPDIGMPRFHNAAIVCLR